MNKQVKVKLSYDSYECECCGWSVDDYGIEVWVDGEQVINKPAIAGCCGNGSGCYNHIDQLKLIGEAFNIPFNQLFKTEDDFENIDQYNEYYCSLLAPKAFENIVMRALTNLGFDVTFV